MALLTITVGRDAGSGRTTVRVGLRSDGDALPHEHEALHRQMVEALLPGADLQREGPDREPVVG